MNSIFASVIALLLVLLTQAHATSEYDYKPGEFRVVEGGKSPDKKFSIVAGENKAGAFAIYLMDAPAKKVIGALEEVATGLDTAPDAYYAHWSPDSKHVGISSRSDRHLMENVIYRIENRRAYAVQTPELRRRAVPEFCQLARELGEILEPEEESGSRPWKIRQNTKYSEITKWISATRFVVREESEFLVKTRDPTAALGQYAEIEKQEPDPDQPGDSYYVWFSAEGECELLSGDKTQVVSVRPSKKKENKK